ncbi:MAG: phosphate transport system regulatory protein PhoU [Planctomycetes bacterium GWF2_42_9]|nr:MAG: phosphate transport system regulatory protein PhoU [Planctomycetes bacterium GWF2_42_9]HAL44867.1 phosphate transport system regulatory protein PhoU [Phycisphaerales bacterium]
MERHFDEELNDLRKNIVQISDLARKAITESIEALKANDKARAQKVIDSDQAIDELELFIDEKCIDLLALYQPMAGDLRFITTGLKLNAELERIADLAVDVAQRVLIVADKPLLKPIVDIPKLGEVAQNMVRDAIESFINKDVSLAEKVVQADDEADMLKDRICDELINDYMSKDSGSVTRAVPLLLIARHLERICDHASNIAEDIFYMVQGKVIKHHHKA